ncbi:PLP-dependent aminotransferase family protein [Roseibacterium sp. SDUM158016]|uniref:aminotransferase-like domain-containing protein n=1 Tax=Roseicyclus sediminis TaxID=2980997 RepID=UPI0021D02DBC|nr:PLP-dependent aminotransferase family protein [Roseibacterium sp. SDUM158016]MCU4652644.1 PLP-dependent aminotransferase family protein [Roseibacterium sp. SDUM158016]
MLADQITIDRDAPESLQKQIRRQIAYAVVSRRIAPNQRLPSIRALARGLGVSTTTVVLAYELLQMDGFITSRNRSGFYVDPDATPALLNSDETPLAEEPSRIDFTKVFSNKRFDISVRVDPPGSLGRYEYPFVPGAMDPKLFPTAQWRECALDAASTLELQSWTGDFTLHDDPLLIEQLIQVVLPDRGIFARPDQILVTAGSQNAAYLSIKLLLQPGDRLAIEDPGYTDAMNMARIEGVDLVALRYGKESFAYDERIATCNCLYVTPSHQVPTNRTLSLDARKALVAAAAEHGQFLIEDDYGWDVAFRAPLPQAIRSLGPSGNVVYLGSPSDMLVAGLRIGYMVADREIIRRARGLRQFILRHPPVANQRSLALFIQRGYLSRLQVTLNKAFRLRSDIALEALEDFFPSLPEAPATGGTSLWLRLPEAVSSFGLQQRLLAQGIYVETGADCFLEESSRDNFIRLGFTAIEVNKIRPGIEKIARTLREMM